MGPYIYFIESTADQNQIVSYMVETIKNSILE